MATVGNNCQPTEPAYAVGGDTDYTSGNVGNIRNRQYAGNSNFAPQDDEKDQAPITFTAPNSKGGLKSINEHKNMDETNCGVENTSFTESQGVVIGLGARQGIVQSGYTATTNYGAEYQYSFQTPPPRRIPQLHRLEK